MPEQETNVVAISREVALILNASTSEVSYLTSGLSANTGGGITSCLSGRLTLLLSLER